MSSSSSIHMPHVSHHHLRPFDQPASRPSSLAAPAMKKREKGESSTANRVQSETRMAPPSSDMLTEEEKQSAKRRRSSFPPVPQSRDISGGAKVTKPSKSQQPSLTEVVARMRFREKTVLGGAFFKAPRKISDSVLENHHATPTANGEGLVKTRKISDTVVAVNHQSPSYNGAVPFNANDTVDAVVVSHPPANGFIPPQKNHYERANGLRQTKNRVPPLPLTEKPPGVDTSLLNSRSVRTRRNGAVLPVPAWETPREAARKTLEIRGTPVFWKNSVSWKTSAAAHTVPEQGGDAPDSHGPRHQQADSEDVPVGGSNPRDPEVHGDADGAGGGDGGGDGEDSDVDFDFDEGEDEVEAQRQARRRCLATSAVYQRACDALRVQPSPAFLRQCNVTSMDLRDIGLGPNDVKPIAIALVRDTNVSFLDLSNNHLGPVGISYIAEMLQENTTLFDLNLSATSPGREGVKALSETLPYNRTLLYLRLEENCIEHTEAHLLADIIRSVPKLHGLYLGHNRLGYRGGAAIASAIAQNSNLLTLDLHWNHIRRDSAVALIKALASNRCLRQLNLAWNGLGKEGCLALAHVLPDNSVLTELDLTCNRLDLLSLGFLLKGLARNSRLTTLKLGQNPITTEGAKAVLETIRTCPDVAVSELDITGVPVDVEFTQMLREVQKTRLLKVRHEEALTLATSDRTREHDGSNLDRYDPVMVLFEYMKLDNLRVIDMFQFMDVRKREKLSKANIRDGLNTLRVPITEHALDVMVERLDLNKDGFVELDEMMKVQRDSARHVKLRQIKAKERNREDESLKGLHQILKQVISKRTEENEHRRESHVAGGTRTSGGGRKSSVRGLQLTQARYSVTALKPPRPHLQPIPDH